MPDTLVIPNLFKEEKKKPKLFDVLTDATIETEGLIEGQTPLRDEKLSIGGRETSRFKDTVQGYPIDWEAWENAPKERKNFYYVSEEDKPKVINQQYKNYINNPKGYGLTEESTLEDVTKKFDKERPINKINYLKNLGIDVKTKIKDLSDTFDLAKLNPFSVEEASAAENKNVVPNLFEKPKASPNVVKGLFDEPKSIIQEGKEIITEAGKASLRGFENLASGVGAATFWLGENIKEGIPQKFLKTITPGTQLLPDIKNAWLKDVETKIGDKILKWGKNAFSFWQEEAQRGIEAPDIETFKGSFMQNPSWTRGVAIVAEAIPSLVGATVIGVATGNPLAGAAALGLLEGSGQYVEARQAGKDVVPANIMGGLSTVGNTILEVLPLTRFVKGGAGKFGKDIFLGAVQEGGEEVLQALWQNSIAKIGYDKTRALTQGMIEGFIGGAGSGGVLGGLTSGRGAQMDNLMKEAIGKGVTPQELNAMQEAVKNQILDNADEIEEKLDKSAVDESEKYNEWLKSKEVTQRTELGVPLHPAPKTSIDKGIVQRLFEEPEKSLVKVGTTTLTNKDLSDAIGQFASGQAGYVEKLGKTIGVSPLLRQTSGKKLWEDMSNEEKFAEFREYAIRDFDIALKEMKNPVDYMLDRALDPLDPMAGVYKGLLKKAGATITEDGAIKLSPELEKKLDKKQIAKPQTLISAIKERGGLDTEQIKKDYNWSEDVKQQRIPIGIFKKGASALDDMADQLQNAGLLKVPANMNASDYLMQQLKDEQSRNAELFAQDLFDQYDKEHDEWLKQKEQEGYGQEEIKQAERELEADIKEEVKGEVDKEEIPDWVTEKQEGEVTPLEQQAKKYKTAEEFVGSNLKEAELISNPSRVSVEERLNLPVSKVKQLEQEGKNKLKHITSADKAKIFFRSTHTGDFTERAESGIFFANDIGIAKQYAGSLFKTEPSKMQIAELDIKNPYYTTKDEIEYHSGKRQEWVKKLKAEGYDSIVEIPSKNPDDMGYDVIPTEVAVFDKSQIKEMGEVSNPEGRNLSDEKLLSRVKSQLTDIWNKAQGGPKAGGTTGGAAAAVAAKGTGYGDIIESSEKSSRVKVAKTDYAKVGEEIPSREETNLMKEALKIVAPARVSAATEGAGLILRKNIAELARKDVLSIEAMKKAHSAFTWMNKEDSHKFIDNIEHGKSQDNTKLQSFSDIMRNMLDSRRMAIQNLGKGQLEGYYENYFPHIWKDPKRAKDVVAQILGRKRLEGTKSFLKKRVIVSVKDGLSRGLELVSDNPVDLVMLKLHEMDRYLMAQNIIKDLKSSGLVKFVYSRSKTPEGYSKINDNAFTVYMPPELTKKEAYDSILVDQLMDISKGLGIDNKRFVSIGTRGWGWAKDIGQGQIRTKYASPESVLAHEIGHVIGYRYGVYNLIGRRKEGEIKVHKKGKKAGEEYFKPDKEAVEYRRDIDKQWRDLADARWKGLKAPDSYKNYVRNSKEKEAVLVEALIHAPKEFQRVAPDLYKHFVEFLNSHSDLRPLLDAEPSLVLGEADAKIKVPGFTTLGHYYTPTDVARLINNHLSPGIRNADNKLVSGSYNILRGVGNVLNQVNLSLSGFHAINVSTDMMASTLGLGLRKLMTKDQRLGGLKDLVSVPFAPIEGIWSGTRIKKAYRQQLDTIKDPKLRTMVEAIVAAGGRDRMDVFYYNQQIKALQETFRDILQGSGIEKLTGAARLPFNVFGSVVEVLAKPIMEWYVPTGKMGLFAKLATHEMQRAESGEITDAQLWDRLASVWDSVDNRMGQLIYDNLFWNKTVKDGLMLAIRSVGWNLGSWREYAGSVVDLATTVSRVKKGDKIFSQKMAYVTGAAVVYSVLGAVITYLLTGKPPEEPKDYFFPKTGRINPDGSAERLSLPTYAKDIYAYSQQPLQTIRNKAHPLIGLLSEEFKNEDFYNVQIANPKDPIFDQIIDRGKHIVNYSKPFSFKNYEKMQRAGEGGKATTFVSITGITSAPAYVSRSAAQKLMYRYIVDRIPDTTRTKEQYEKSEYRKTLKNRIRKGEKVDFQEAYEYLGTESLKKTIKEAKMPPFAELYKRLSVNEALNVYAIATLKEKQQTREILIDKFRRAYKDKKITPDMVSMLKELLR